jgi:hypothetical protein
MRNITIYYLLQCFRTITRIDHIEYLIDYVPLVLLCHSSCYTIVHQTARLCLHTLTENLSNILVEQSEHIVDCSLRKLHTSFYDGYLILIEFVRLGRYTVINLPIMAHVIEQLLVELSCLPSLESIQLTFEFFHMFCQQVTDIVDNKQHIVNNNEQHVETTLIDYALDLQRQYRPLTQLNDAHVDVVDDDDNNEKKTNVEHVWHRMLTSIVDVFQHFISHDNVQIRSHVLDALPSLAHVLSTIDENRFLPLVHKLWPGIIHRLHDHDVNIRIRCLTIIQCLCRLCSDFVDRRIQQDILPVLIEQLERHRFITSSHTLEYRYIKCLLNNIASIVNAITVSFEQIERIILSLFQYLHVELLASIAYEQLIVLATTYADEIWLKLMLHDDNEYRQGYFQQMKVYKPQPRLNIDMKWKSNLFVCLTQTLTC